MEKKNNIKNLLVDEKSSLRKIISVINSNRFGACFVTSKSKFKAVITDGDIRRLILRNHKLNKNICSFVNRKKSITASYLSSNLDILKKLSDKIKIIPILDAKKRILDFSTIEKVKKINIYETFLKGNETNYVMNCLRTNWISSTGKYVTLFEKKFSQLFKTKYSLSLSSGTSGLHLAMKTLNIGIGDEVIVPNVTFAATVNSIINSGAKPVFVDIEKTTYNLNPNKILKKITKKTKAIICVHLYGQPCEMDQISKIAKKKRLYLVEDCAEALGSKYNGKFVSYFGDISVFSFFGNKTITTGEGGMLVTNKKDLFNKAKSLRDHGMDEKKKYWHNDVGFNYRMTNMQAAIGLAQLENVNDIIKRKIQIALKYEKEIDKLNPQIREKIILPYKSKIFLNTFWLYNIRIKDLNETKRDELIKRLRASGIECRNFFYPFSRMKIYKKYIKNENDLKISSEISDSGICLPSFPGLKFGEIEFIIKKLAIEINRII